MANLRSILRGAGVLALAMLLSGTAAITAEVTVTLYRSTPNGPGEQIGMVTALDTAKGLKLIPNLSGLSEGAHGFHVHQKANCGPAEKDGATVPSLAAGGHFDPKGTGRHAGPNGDGHLGDLPILIVDAQGRATRSSFAPRLKTSDIRGRAMMIHAGGDNYSDKPKALGGGGKRVACGIIN